MIFLGNQRSSFPRFIWFWESEPVHLQSRTIWFSLLHYLRKCDYCFLSVRSIREMIFHKTEELFLTNCKTLREWACPFTSNYCLQKCDYCFLSVTSIREMIFHETEELFLTNCTTLREWACPFSLYNWQGDKSKPGKNSFIIWKIESTTKASNPNSLVRQKKCRLTVAEQNYNHQNFPVELFLDSETNSNTVLT